MPDYDPASYGDEWAAIYDEWHAGLADDDPAIAFLVDLAGDGPALELAVGTGRLALPLAARGISVTGIDSSAAMLDRLRAKPGADRLTIVEGDMARDDAGRRDFSLVFVVANSLFLLLDQNDQVACFENAARHLRPGGVFVVHAFVPDLSRFRDDRNLSTRDVSDDVLFLDASVHDPLTQIVRSHHVHIRSGGTELHPVTIRYSWPAELDLMGRLAGIPLRERFADVTRAPFTAYSPFHVSVYQRPG